MSLIYLVIIILGCSDFFLFSSECKLFSKYTWNYSFFVMEVYTIETMFDFLINHTNNFLVEIIS